MKLQCNFSSTARQTGVSEEEGGEGLPLTCSSHGHREGQHEITRADLARVAAVQSSEDVPQDDVGVTPGKHLPHHLHDLGLGEFSLREANLEGAPELHDLLVCQSLPLQQLSRSVLLTEHQSLLPAW